MVFGADLKAVSLLGTQIEFKRNTEHVWFIAFAINAYLLLRFYQQRPGVSYLGTKEYKGYYDNYMRDIMLWINRALLRARCLSVVRAVLLLFQNMA